MDAQVLLAEIAAFEADLLLEEIKANENNEYAMIAFYLPPDVAKRLAVPGGEPPEELHLTLAFLGKATDIDNPDMLRGVVAEMAKITPPLQGKINGVGRFIQTHKDGTHAVYASPDLKDLPSFRERLISNIGNSNLVNLPSEHGFVPHITLTYVPEDKPTPDNLLPVSIPVTFNTVSVVVGDHRADYQLRGTNTRYYDAPDVKPYYAKAIPFASENDWEEVTTS